MAVRMHRARHPLVLFVLFVLLAGWSSAAPCAGQDETARAAAEPPAIVLLLREAIPLEVEAVRGRLAKVLAAEVHASGGAEATWLGAADGGLRGAHAGVAFTIRFVDAPLELAPATIGHLGEDGAKTLRGHRAHLVIAGAAV